MWRGRNVQGSSSPIYRVISPNSGHVTRALQAWCPAQQLGSALGEEAFLWLTMSPGNSNEEIETVRYFYVKRFYFFNLLFFFYFSDYKNYHCKQLMSPCTSPPPILRKTHTNMEEREERIKNRRKRIFFATEIISRAELHALCSCGCVTAGLVPSRSTFYRLLCGACRLFLYFYGAATSSVL